jgi:hypothetical protein
VVAKSLPSPPTIIFSPISKVSRAAISDKVVIIVEPASKYSYPRV